MEKIAGIILAAGKGTRMNQGTDSDKPKVMYEIAGKPMIDYSVKSLRDAGVEKIVLVVGYKKELIMEYFGDKVEYAIQEEQLGTGHAAMMAGRNLRGKSDAVIVSCGDMPLIKPSTITNLMKEYEKVKPTIAMLVAKSTDAGSYGRIVRDEAGDVEKIVEAKDCSPLEIKIQEWNPAFYIFDANWLWENFSQLKSNNVQKEYYLTDIIAIAKKQGKKVITTQVSSENEVLGINTQEHLADVEKLLAN